jgi:hypothetical protein
MVAGGGARGFRGEGDEDAAAWTLSWSPGIRMTMRNFPFGTVCISRTFYAYPGCV